MNEELERFLDEFRKMGFHVEEEKGYKYGAYRIKARTDGRLIRLMSLIINENDYLFYFWTKHKHLDQQSINIIQEFHNEQKFHDRYSHRLRTTEDRNKLIGFVKTNFSQYILRNAGDEIENQEPEATFELEQANFEEAVRKAQSDSAEARKERLEIAHRKPESFFTTITAFRRNPDVVAETLHRAKEHCEHCKKPGPFRRTSDNTPYLEVHHKIPLAQGGDDTVENAIALCPNCHREAHFGGLKL